MKNVKKQPKSASLGKKKSESTAQKTKSFVAIPVTLPCELHEWSETLTYAQITDTLFAVNVYLERDQPDAISEHDKKLIDSWLNRGNLDKFLLAKQNARIEYQKLLEDEARVFDIMSYSTKHPMSH